MRTKLCIDLRFYFDAIIKGKHKNTTPPEVLLNPTENPQKEANPTAQQKQMHDHPSQSAPSTKGGGSIQLYGPKFLTFETDQFLFLAM